MINEAEVAQFLSERIRQSPGTLGAPLGALANAQFPGVNFRMSYGGLREFVKKFCGPEIEIVRGQWGKDDFYRWRGEGASVAANDGPAQDAPSVTFRDHETPWRVFTVPESKGRLCVDPESANLQVAQSEEDVPGMPTVEIPKLTADEHRQIASDFLIRMDSEDRGHFEEILKGSDFWQHWFMETRRAAGGKYLKPWLAFRFDRICDLFRQRLGAIGLSETAANACLERLKRSKAADRPVSNRWKRAYRVSRTSSESLHDVARAALDALSEEEIRRVWLPLGVVADVLRNLES